MILKLLAPSSRKLVFMYLANDVIQNSKKKGPEYGMSYAPLLVKAFKHISHHCEDEKTFNSLKRILDVWEERGVYDKEMIKEWKGVLKHPKPKKPHSSSNNSKPKEESSASKKRKSEEPSANNSTENDKKKHKTTTPSKAKILEVNGETHVTLSPTQQPLGDPPEPEELIKMLESLENAASSDAATREKITKLPPEVSNISELNKIEDKEAAIKLSKKVNDAVELLKEYNSRLASEMTDRNKLAVMLKDFQKEQQELLAQAEQRLEVNYFKKKSIECAIFFINLLL
jgi:regulator of Ty1 transposition protein 103